MSVMVSGNELQKRSGKFNIGDVLSLNKDDINIEFVRDLVVTQGKTHPYVSLFLQEASVSRKERLYFVVRPNCFAAWY